MMSSTQSIGFIGAGKMATALAIGFLKSGLTQTSQLMASDVHEGARVAFETLTQARTTSSNLEVAKASRVILLAVKPQQMEGMLRELGTVLTPQHLVVSIAAGVTIAKMLKWLGRDDARIVNRRYGSL